MPSTGQHEHLDSSATRADLNELIPQRISFMEIPVEIRIQIYTLLLKSSSPFELWDVRQKGVDGSAFRTFAAFKPNLALLLHLNKTISSEAAEVFYGTNEFRFTDIDGWVALDSFLYTIGSHNFQFLETLTVHAPFISIRGRFRDVKIYFKLLRNMGMKVVPYDILSVPAPYVVPRSDDDTILGCCSFYQACQRLGGIKTLKKLRLVLPCRHPLDGFYHVAGRGFFCPETCTSTDLWHLQVQHADHFFRTQLNNLRSAIPRLDVTVVLLHIKQLHGWSRLCEADLSLAKSNGYSVGYGIEDLDALAPPYDVVDCKDIEEASYPFEIPPFHM